MAQACELGAVGGEDLTEEEKVEEFLEKAKQVEEEDVHIALSYATKASKLVANMQGKNSAKYKKIRAYIKELRCKAIRDESDDDEQDHLHGRSREKLTSKREHAGNQDNRRKPTRPHTGQTMASTSAHQIFSAMDSDLNVSDASMGSEPSLILDCLTPSPRHAQPSSADDPSTGQAEQSEMDADGVVVATDNSYPKETSQIEKEGLPDLYPLFENPEAKDFVENDIAMPIVATQTQTKTQNVVRKLAEPANAIPAPAQTDVKAPQGRIEKEMTTSEEVVNRPVSVPNDAPTTHLEKETANVKPEVAQPNAEEDTEIKQAQELRSEENLSNRHRIAQETSSEKSKIQKVVKKLTSNKILWRQSHGIHWRQLHRMHWRKSHWSTNAIPAPAQTDEKAFENPEAKDFVENDIAMPIVATQTQTKTQNVVRKLAEPANAIPAPAQTDVKAPQGRIKKEMTTPEEVVNRPVSVPNDAPTTHLEKETANVKPEVAQPNAEEDTEIRQAQELRPEENLSNRHRIAQETSSEKFKTQKVVKKLASNKILWRQLGYHGIHWTQLQGMHCRKSHWSTNALPAPAQSDEKVLQRRIKKEMTTSERVVNWRGSIPDDALTTHLEKETANVKLEVVQPNAEEDTEIRQAQELRSEKNLSNRHRIPQETSSENSVKKRLINLVAVVGQEIQHLEVSQLKRSQQLTQELETFVLKDHAIQSSTSGEALAEGEGKMQQLASATIRSKNSSLPAESEPDQLHDDLNVVPTETGFNVVGHSKSPKQQESSGGPDRNTYDAEIRIVNSEERQSATSTFSEDGHAVEDKVPDSITSNRNDPDPPLQSPFNIVGNLLTAFPSRLNCFQQSPSDILLTFNYWRRYWATEGRMEENTRRPLVERTSGEALAGEEGEMQQSIPATIRSKNSSLPAESEPDQLRDDLNVVPTETGFSYSESPKQQESSGGPDRNAHNFETHVVKSEERQSATSTFSEVGHAVEEELISFQKSMIKISNGFQLDRNREIIAMVTEWSIPEIDRMSVSEMRNSITDAVERMQTVRINLEKAAVTPGPDNTPLQEALKLCQQTEVTLGRLNAVFRM